MNYVQCTLRKENTHTVAWIPTVGKNKKKVEVGCQVELGDTKEFWTVTHMGQVQSKDKVKARERDFKRHRQFSDV